MRDWDDEYFKMAEDYVVNQLKLSREHEVIKTTKDGIPYSYIAWETSDVEDAYIASIKKGKEPTNKVESNNGQIKTFSEKCSDIKHNWESVEDAMTTIRNPAALEINGFHNGVMWIYQNLKNIRGKYGPDLTNAFKLLGIEGMENWE